MFVLNVNKNVTLQTYYNLIFKYGFFVYNFLCFCAILVIVFIKYNNNVILLVKNKWQNNLNLYLQPRLGEIL